MSAINIDVFRNTPYIYQFHATGQVYHAWYQLTVAAGASEYIEFRQAGDNIVHLLDYSLRSQATNISLALHKNPTFDQGSVRINWSSYNHKITKPPTLELYQDPTNIDLTGSVETFRTKGYGSSVGETSFADIASVAYLEEMYDDQNTYLVEITNHNGSPHEFFLHIVWYESGN